MRKPTTIHLTKIWSVQPPQSRRAEMDIMFKSVKAKRGFTSNVRIIGSKKGWKNENKYKGLIRVLLDNYPRFKDQNADIFCC